MTEHDSGAAPTDGTDGGTASDDFPTIPRLPVVPAVICLGDFLPDDPAVATRLDHVVDGTRPLVGTRLPVHAVDVGHRVGAAVLLGGTPLAAAVAPLALSDRGGAGGRPRHGVPTGPALSSGHARAAARVRRGRRARGVRPPSTVVAGVAGLVGAAAVLTAAVSAGLSPTPASNDVVVEAAPTGTSLPTPDGATPGLRTEQPGDAVPTAATTTTTTSGEGTTTSPGALPTTPVTASPTRSVDPGAPATVGLPTTGTATLPVPVTSTPAVTDMPAPTAAEPLTTTEAPAAEPTSDLDPTESEPSVEPTPSEGEGEETPPATDPETVVDPPPTSTTDEWLVLGLGGLGLGAAGRHRARSGRHRARHDSTPTSTRSKRP